MKVFLHAGVSNEQVLTFAVKDTLLFYLFMRKKMLLSILVLENDVASIDSTEKFLFFEYLLK